MQGIVTVRERKAREANRRRDAVAALRPILSAYARAHGGRFLLYGSAARGTMKYDSDVDLLLDFPDDAMTEAWNFAEAACWDRGLEADLLPYGWCKTEFLDHVAPDLRVLA
jgi:predicted nucleotidyltransferase